MQFLSRAALALGLARAATEGDASAYAADVTPPARSGRTVVPVREALTLDSVYRAMLIFQTAVSQLTLDVWRGDEPLKVTPSLVATPDVNDDQSGFLADTVASMSARGNGYWLHHRGPDGDVLSLEVIDPLKATPFRDRHGRKLVAYNGRDHTRAEMTHLRLLRVPGEPVGLGPIQAAARRLAGALDVATYADQWFTDSGVPASGSLNTEQNLTKEQAGLWQAQWHEREPGKVAVLGSGLEYKTYALTPKEAQWIESQAWSVTTVARLFGIPPRLLLAAIEGDSMTYTNAETEDRQFVKYSLAGYLRPIEQAMTALLPRGQTARFNLEGFLRGDTKTRYEAHQIALSAGFLRVPEVRRIEGLSPLPDEAPEVSPREVTEAIQKIYLGVGKVLSAEEARTILNRAGAGLTGDFEPLSPAVPAPAPEESP